MKEEKNYFQTFKTKFSKSMNILFKTVYYNITFSRLGFAYRISSFKVQLGMVIG